MAAIRARRQSEEAKTREAEEEKKRWEEEEKRKSGGQLWGWWYVKARKGGKKIWRWMTREEMIGHRRRMNKRSGRSEERRMEWLMNNQVVEEVCKGWLWVEEGNGWEVVDKVGGWTWV